MRKIHVIGNWKMNHNLDSCLEFCTELKDFIPSENVIAGIAPPFPLIGTCRDNLSPKIKLSAQNCHSKTSGAYTGEVSCDLLKSVGCSSVVIGHSERRMYNHESDANILTKTRSAISANLRVIFCCGESLEIREAGAYKDFVAAQLANSVCLLISDEIKKVIIAYEPIWAIGTGRTASSEQAEEMCAFIRSKMSDAFGDDIANSMIILYGGSVKPANCVEIFGKDNVDGGLVGGASLKAASFREMIELSADI